MVGGISGARARTRDIRTLATWRFVGLAGVCRRRYLCYRINVSRFRIVFPTACPIRRIAGSVLSLGMKSSRGEERNSGSEFILSLIKLTQ